MTAAVRLQQRPLSPHLQIYRRQMTMVISILHRITGAALYPGHVVVGLGTRRGRLKRERLCRVWIVVGSPLGKSVLFLDTGGLLRIICCAVFAILFGAREEDLSEPRHTPWLGEH